MQHRAIMGAAKTGSISREQARTAARVAKTAQPRSDSMSATSASKAKRLSQTSSVWERFLGHFGGTGSRNETRTASASIQVRAEKTAPAIKKTAAKKKGANKPPRVA